MCIAYLDPGNLEADLQVGAYTGYSLVGRLGRRNGRRLIEIRNGHVSEYIELMLAVRVQSACRCGCCCSRRAWA